MHLMKTYCMYSLIWMCNMGVVYSTREQSTVYVMHLLLVSWHLWEGYLMLLWFNGYRVIAHYICLHLFCIAVLFMFMF